MNSVCIGERDRDVFEEVCHCEDRDWNAFDLKESAYFLK